MTAQEHYDLCIANGCSPRLAEMFALQQPPMSNTDREFLEGHCNGNQFAGNPALGDALARDAREAGVDITGKIYKDSLARFPGDPEAWVGGRGDVERIARKRGLRVRGSVNVDYMPRDTPPPAEVEIAEDLVQAEVAEILTTVPDPHMVDTVDLAHQVREKRKPRWKEPKKKIEIGD